MVVLRQIQSYFHLLNDLAYYVAEITEVEIIVLTQIDVWKDKKILTTFYLNICLKILRSN